MDPRDLRRFCLEAAIATVQCGPPEDYIRAADKFFGYVMHGSRSGVREAIERLCREER